MIRRPIDDVWLTADVATQLRASLAEPMRRLAALGVTHDEIPDEEVVAHEDGTLDIRVRVRGEDVVLTTLRPEQWAWMAGEEPAE